MTITETMGELYELLKPLDADERNKCLQAVMILLGEPVQGVVKNTPSASAGVSSTSTVRDEEIGGERLKKWMIQHKLGRDEIDQLFHIDGDMVELIEDSVPGRSKRDMTINCYLLVGIRNLIQSDEPKFEDKEALDYCHVTQAYDKNNHTKHRQSLGNRVSGDRASGYGLTVPGLRDAARLIKAMNGEESE
jgi:hypothetical protein